MPASATRGPIGPVKRAAYAVDSGATPVANRGMIKGALDSSCANPTGAGQRLRGIAEFVPFNFGVAGAPGGGGDPNLQLIQEGETLAECGAAVSSDDYVVMDSEGRFITSTTVADEVCGIARSSTANAGDLFVIDVDPFIR